MNQAPHQTPPHEILGPNGQIYRIKQPLYKQGLFWSTIAGAVIIFFMGLVIMGLAILNLSYSSKFAQGSDQSELYQDDYKDLTFGESVQFADGLKITVSSVKKDLKRKMTDESTGVAVVAEVEVKNTSRHSVSFTPYDFYLYDDEGEIYILDGSTFTENDIDEEIPAGKTVKMTLVFDGENGEQDNYSIAYDYAMWEADKSVTF